MKTIYDIAKDLKVAPSTVSKALNGGPGVSEKTRKKIVRYANKVRYIPNANASRLKTKRSYSIGIIYSESLNIGLEHHFFSRVIQSFKDSVEKSGYEITFVIKNLGNIEMTFLEFCRHKQLDGVFIVVAEPSDPDLIELIASGIPCVTTDMIDDNVFTVMSDNLHGSKVAVQKLFEAGHRRIGHVSGPVDSIAGVERLVGYREGLKEVGLEGNEDYIYIAKEFNFEAGYFAVANMLNLPETERPTALYICSDDIALGVLKRLKENGYKIPRDIALIGFDDIPFACHFEPPLSTMRQDTQLLGESTATYLINKIEGKDMDDSKELRIKPIYIQRESV